MFINYFRGFCLLLDFDFLRFFLDLSVFGCVRGMGLTTGFKKATYMRERLVLRANDFFDVMGMHLLFGGMFLGFFGRPFF